MYSHSQSLQHQYHRQPPQDTAQGYLSSPHSASSSSNSIHPTMSTQQEYTHKETDSAVSPYCSRSGPSRDLQGEPQSNYRLLEAWHTVPWDRSAVMNRIQTPDINEIADGKSPLTRLHSQSFQGSTSERPSKRRRDAFSDTTLLTTFTAHQPTDRVLPPFPLMNPMLRFPLASAAQSSCSSSRNPNKGPPPALLLLDADLWMEFHEEHNEMIVTKAGRCLFPCLKFKAVNLDPDVYYSFRLDFEILSPNRFRFFNGSWKVVEPLKHTDDDPQGPSDSTGGANPALLDEYYAHPDGFQLGSHWMANPISFAKAKLTNKTESQSSIVRRAAKNKANSGHARNGDDFDVPPGSQNLGGANRINTNVFHMTSFHKYRPRLCLIQRDKDSNSILESTTYRYDRTEFTAVTHYQNHKVNDLKKSYNPHAKGFRGTIGKVMPPVKLPVGQYQQQQEHRAPDSQPSMTTHPHRPNKRSCTSWRSNEIDSDDEMGGDEDGDDDDELDGDVDDLDSDDMNMSEVADVGTSGGSGTNTNRTRSEAMSAIRKSSLAASASRENKNTSPSCRLNKDNNALITISLGGEQQDDDKVSEQTTNHYFDQPTALNGEAIDVPGYHSRSSAGESTWTTGQMFLPLASSNNYNDGKTRSRNFNGMDQPPPHCQQHQQQENQQQALLVTGQDDETGERVSRRAISPLHPLFSNRAPTTQLDRVPTHLSDDNNNASNSLSMPSPTSMTSMNAGRDAVYLPISDDDNDNAAALLHFNQSAPAIPIEPLDNTIISDQDNLQVPSTDLNDMDLVVAAGETTGALTLNTASPPPTLSWYQQFLWDHNATSSAVPSAVDTSNLPLSFQLETVSSAAAGEVGAAHSTRVPAAMNPSSTLNPQGASSLFPVDSFLSDEAGSNSDVSSMSALGIGTSTPSSTLSGGSSSSHSGAYGGGFSSHGGNSASGFGAGTGNEGFQQDPRMMKMTILESKTFMSTSSVVSTMPSSGQQFPHQAELHRVLRENRQLRAFIRARYGPEAEAEANAVMAMEQRRH